MPKISVITASYNYENYIKETIESVLAQTYTDWEMIVVDDGSTDNSVDVIKSYCERDSRIKLYQHENGINKGLVETVKLGIEKANSEWLVFLESDDTITPDYMEVKLDALSNHPELVFIFNDINMFGDFEVIDSYNKMLKSHRAVLERRTYPTNFLDVYQTKNIVPTFSVVMLRKDIMFGLDYNVVFKPYLDWYLWAQLAAKYQFYYVDKKLTNWRMSKTSYISVSRTPEEIRDFKLQLLRITHPKFNFWKIFYLFRIFEKYLLSTLKRSFKAKKNLTF